MLAMIMYPVKSGEGNLCFVTLTLNLDDRKELERERSGFVTESALSVTRFFTTPSLRSGLRLRMTISEGFRMIGGIAKQPWQGNNAGEIVYG